MHTVPTAGIQELPRHPPCLIRRQEHYDIGDVLGLAYSSQGRLRYPRTLHLRSDVSRLYWSWCYDVDRNTILPQLRGGRTAVGLDRMLARRIADVPVMTMRCIGAEIDDASPGGLPMCLRTNSVISSTVALTLTAKRRSIPCAEVMVTAPSEAVTPTLAGSNVSRAQ